MPEGGPPRPAGSSIGHVLAEARTARGLDVEAVSRTTRVRAGLISDIEQDDFTRCGGAFYARGHIRSIARAVGVDPEPLVAEFDRRYGSPVELPSAVAETLEPSAVGWRALRPPRGPNWPAAMALALVVVIILAGVALLAPGGGSRHHTAAVLAAPTRSVHPEPTLTATAPPQGSVAFAGVSVQVRLLQAASWFHVVDGAGTLLFQGVLGPGTVRDFHAVHSLSFVIGNAGAVDLVVNGHDLGLAGSPGEVVHPSFTPTSSSLS